MINEIARTLLKHKEEIESSHMPYVSFMSVIRNAFSHQAMLQFNGNALQASESLNMNRRTFMTNLGMSAGEWKLKYMSKDKDAAQGGMQ